MPKRKVLRAGVGAGDTGAVSALLVPSVQGRLVPACPSRWEKGTLGWNGSSWASGEWGECCLPSPRPTQMCHGFWRLWKILGTVQGVLLLLGRGSRPHGEGSVGGCLSRGTEVAAPLATAGWILLLPPSTASLTLPALLPLFSPQRRFRNYLPRAGRRGLHLHPQVPPVPPADQQGVGQPPRSLPAG